MRATRRALRRLLVVLGGLFASSCSSSVPIYGMDWPACETDADCKRNQGPDWYCEAATRKCDLHPDAGGPDAGSEDAGPADSGR